MTKHARLSPSNLRWPHCPGSIREEEPYPDVAGEAAIDGTGSHLLLELCLTEDVTPDYFVGRIIGANHEDKPSGWMVEADRAERVMMALNYISRRRKELREQFGTDAVITVESESSSDVGGMFGRKDWRGTCDVTIEVTLHDKCVFIETIDYKDGRGWVHVEGNTQLISYAGGKIRRWIASGKDLVRPFKPENISHGVRTTIVQPKTNPPVRYHDYSTKEVVDLLCDLSLKASYTDRKDAPLIAGKHCQWCKHKPNCTVQSEQSTEVLKTMSEDVKTTEGLSLFELMNDVIKDVANVSSEKLTELADARPGIEALFDQVEKEIQSRIEAGQEVDGYEMKPGRSSRVWSLSDEEMADVLKARRLKNAEIFPPKLVSPAQVMKLTTLSDTQKKRLEEEYITVKAGALKLTKTGKRKTESVDELFNDVAQSKTNVVQLNQDIPSFM